MSKSRNKSYKADLDPFKHILSPEVYADEDKLYTEKFKALLAYLEPMLPSITKKVTHYPKQYELFVMDYNKVPIALLYPFEKGFLLTRLSELIFRQRVDAQMIFDVLGYSEDDMQRTACCRDFNKITNDKTSMVLYTLIHEFSWEPGCGRGDKILECLLSMNLTYHFKYPDLG